MTARIAAVVMGTRGGQHSIHGLSFELVYAHSHFASRVSLPLAHRLAFPDLFVLSHVPVLLFSRSLRFPLFGRRLSLVLETPPVTPVVVLDPRPQQLQIIPTFP